MAAFDLLDLYANRVDRPNLIDAEGLAKAEQAPAVDVNGFGTMTDLAYRSERSQLPDWMGLRVYEMTSDAIDQAFKITGKSLANPYSTISRAPSDESLTQRRGYLSLGEQAPADSREVRVKRFTEEYAALRAEHPDLPDPATFAEKARAEMRGRIAELRAQGVGATGLGDIGEFVGAAGGQLVHPVNLATLPFGAPAALYGVARGGLLAVLGRIAAAGAIEGTVAAGAQAVVGLEKWDRLPGMGVRYDASDYVEEILGAAAAGLLLGGGLRALVAGYRGLRGTAGASRLSPLDHLDGADAASVGERLILERSAIANPEAMAEARRAVAAGERVEVGPILAAERDGNMASSFGTRAAPSDGVVSVYTPAGRRVAVQYEVADLRSLIPSHTDDLRPNAAYPAGLQPRDRGRAASEAQIAEIAGNLNPERLGPSADATTGAPIVGPDNVVESGNGRVLAMRRAPPERQAAYKAWLKSQGFEVEGIERPVLVARRAEALSDVERAAFAREANQATAMRMGAAEQAAADAGIVSRVLDLYRGGAPDLVQNQDFLRAFAKGLPASERAGLVTKSGTLSQEGVRRVNAALLHAAYGDGPLVAKLMESPSNDIKAIGGALMDNAAGWAQMRARAAAGEIAAGMDRTADLIGAVRLVEAARAGGIKPADMMAQGALFESPEATRLFVAMFHREADLERAAGRATISERLAGYIDEANKTQAGPDLFGAAPPSARDVLLATDRDRVMASVADDAARVQADTPKAARAVDSAVEDARVTEARAAVEAKDFPMAVQEGDNLVIRKASDVLGDADEAVKLAEAARGCAVGSAI